MGSFSISGGVEVYGFISPSNTTDQYPVIDPLYGIDGLRNVNTLSDLDLIPILRRRAGMLVGVSGGTVYYKLKDVPWNNTIADWEIFELGSNFTGGTVMGATIFTNGLTANTISATTYLNLPTDVFVTGGSYSNGVATFSNNTGGTFNVIGFFTGNTDNFITGGTFNKNTETLTLTNVSGGTISISGFSDVFVTGGTYNNNTFTFTNNTGGTFNVLFNSVTGLTSSGTIQSNIISATTYQNLPKDIFVTGGTFSGGSIVFTNNSGGTFNVSGISSFDTFVTGFSYSNNTFTISQNSGSTLSTTINSVTGLTSSGTIQSSVISATTYQNLPTDIRVTGGTYTTGTATFTNNTGGTFNVTGFVTGDTFVTGLTFNNSNYNLTITRNDGVSFTDSLSILASDLTITGGTYNSTTGTATFTNNTGGTFNVTGFLTGFTDIYVTGGTYSAGTLTFTNTSGGTFSVSGLPTTTTFTGGTVTGSTNFTNGLSANTISATTYQNLPTDIRVTGATYSNNTFTFRNNTGGTFNVLFNTVTGLTSTGTIQSSVISATTYQNLPTDVRITGGTLNKNTDTITFTNNTGGTFNVTGVTDTFVTGATFSGTSLIISQNENQPNVTANLSTVSLSGALSSVTFNIITTGGISASTISATTYQNLPTDIRVTGGTYSNGTATFTNNTGGTFNVSGFFTGSTEVFVTGASYSNNIFTYTNNTGGTFNVLFNNVTGLTSSGTIQSNILSATTYQNLPTDVFVTGGTFGGGSLTFTNNTGGTFNVSGISSFDTFVTGFSYNNNTFTIEQNSGSSLTATINSVTGLTINGNLNVTGTSSASTFNITTTPTTNTTDFDVLVRNAISGNIEQRTFNSLDNIPNVVTVSLSGGTADFTSVKDAIDSISGASSTNPYIVKVGPGVYNENPITMKSFVAILGESSVSTIVNAVDPNQTLFNAVDNTFISDLLIQGCTGTNVSAVVYSSSTSVPSNAIVYVENVRFGANYTHVKNNPFGGGNTAIQCTNIKYGAQPFTLGFYMTSDGASTGRFQLRNVTTTAGGVVNATGLTFAKVDQPNCTIIGNLVTVTKAGSAPVSGIGFHVENGGLLRLNGFNIQRFGTGIYVPQVGSAPTIDAVGLNFENCTTDVDIIHSGTTGKVNGTDSFLKTKINIDAPLYEVNQDPRNITVAKKGGDFSSIKAAVDYLAASGNTSSNNRFIISVGPGEFTEGEIDLTNTPYVSIVGSNIQTTLIKPSGSTQHIINIGASNEISFLTLSGAGSNYAAIHCDDIGNFAQCHKVSFIDCDTNIWVKSSTIDTTFYGEYVDFNGEYTYGVRVEAQNGFGAIANIENYYQFPTSTGATIGNYVEGIGGIINCAVTTMDGTLGLGSTAFEVVDGARLNLASVDINSWEYGVRNPNIGTGVTFEVVATIWSDCTNDISVENVSSIGKFQGIASHVKLFTVSPNIYWLFLDPDDGELDITRKGSVTFTDGTHTDFTTLLFEGGTMGLLDGGLITEVSGFTINTQTGFGYLESPTTPGVIKRIDWSDTQLVLTSGSTSYIFINENGILSAGGIPNTEDVILLGRVVTDDTGIEFIENSPLLAEHTSNKLSTFARTALGPIYATGSIVSENLSNPFEIDVTTGQYFFAEVEFMPTGGTSIQFIQYYRNGLSGWTTSASTIISNTLYDNNGTLTGLTTSAYTKHTLYVLGDTTDEKYFLVFGQDEYMTLVETEDAPLPTPPTYFSDAVTPIASIYVQESATGITQIQDIRPVIGFRAAGVNASSVHGNLLGLGADDHTQYLLVDGNRSMSGNLNMDNNNIISAGTINGVTIQTHATRHQYNGADAVGTLTPTAFAIPYADSNGLLDNWVSTGSTSTLGRVKLSTSPLVASNPIVVGDNDTRVTQAISGGSFNNSTDTLTLNRNDGSTLQITGFTDVFVTGGTYNNGDITFTNNTGGTFNVSGLFTGSTDVFVTGGTYSNGDITFTNNTGGTFNVVGFFTGGTDVFVTGGTFDKNTETLTLTNVTGGTISITGFSDVFVTGGTYSNGDITFTNNTGGTFNVSGLFTGGTDVFVTGGTYSNGTATFTNNTGGTFNVVGFFTGGTDVFVTGASYNNNTFTYTNNTGGTFNVLFNTVTGLTVNGNLSVTGTTSSGTISATTYQNLPTDIRVTGASYSNNTFTFTNNTGGTFSTLFNTVTGLTVNGNLSVTGNTNVRGLTGTTALISGSGQNILTIVGSGSTQPLFTVQGSSGELFSITDSLTGSLFSVNDISGLPILEVFSDNTILMGNYLAPSLYTTTRVSLTAGTNTIYSIPTSAYTGAFFEYTLISSGATGARSGNIMSIWSGSTVNFTETQTTDIGTTTDVTFNMGIVGSNAVLSSSATTAGWTVKTIIKSI